MLIRKIRKKFNRLTDDYFTRLLLKNIRPIEIKNSEYIFIFNHVKSKFTGKLYILISHELSKHGIGSCFPYKNDLLNPYYPRLDIDGYELSNSFISEKRFSVKSLHEQQLFYKWAIDIDGKKIEAEGINFYHIIKNTLRTVQKRYNIFYRDENNKPVYNDLIHTCDLLLKYFFLLKNYSKTNNKKIRFVTFEVDYVPNGVFKILCDQFSHHRDVECIELRRGYISYFGEHHPKASYVSCYNLTKNNAETGLAISQKEWVEKDIANIKRDELTKSVSDALEKKIYNDPPESQIEVVNVIEDYKTRGKNIFVLFSHVFYDTPIDDRSEVFSGMCEWIIKTIKYFSVKEDLLLVKPHPAEYLKDQPQKTPNETLASFLANIDLPKNIILLEPHQFTVKDLSPFISCGLIWRSSVAMELVFLGIPCIIAGNPIYRVLDLIFAKNMEHYFQLIDTSNKIRVTDKQREDVATYLYLLERKHTHIDCISYSKRKKFHWKGKALRKYLKYGDEKIKSVVDEMLS